MGTSGAPTTRRLVLGRSVSPWMPAGFPRGTTITGSFRAKTTAFSTSPALSSTPRFSRSAAANRSARAPCSSWVRSSWLPSRAAARERAASRGHLRHHLAGAGGAVAGQATQVALEPLARQDVQQALHPPVVGELARQGQIE